MLANDWRNYEMMGDYISHHGILGMKWGIRRFQNPDGTRTPAGKARYNEGDSKSSNPVQKVGDAIQKGKTDKQRKAALEKARQAKAQKAEHEADKKKALESGDYKQIQKYSNELTTQELKSALDRADTLARLNQTVARNTPVEKTVWDKIDDAANKVQTITNAADKGKNAWNAFAKAWNTFADADSMLPEIGTNFAEEQDKKRKEKAESDRKEKVTKIAKSLDPKKIVDNQALFTKDELKSAKERYETVRDLKKEIKGGSNKDSNKKSKGDKKKESFSDFYDKLEERETKLIEKQRETDKENEAKSAAKKAADLEISHEKFNQSFDKAKELAQKELDDAVKRSQRSVYNESIDSPKFNNYTYYWDF